MNSAETIQTSSRCSAPAEFSIEEKNDFTSLVIVGGEVDPDGLRDRVETALRLCFMHDRKKVLCGVAALKQQTEEYRAKIFQRAEASDQAANFPYELGWAVVREEFRGHRLSRRLVESVLRLIDDSNGVYATVRLENERMRRTLIHYGFRSEGTHFRSTRGPYDLALYLKDGKAMPSYLSEPFTAKGQFHGSSVRFSSFSADGLQSLGFHFGDIAQALDFSKETGFIYKADLTFARLLDLTNDWGWTSAPHLAFLLHSECFQRGIPYAHEDFEPFLGPGPWSSATLKKGKGISADEQKSLCHLFRKHGFDGVRYINHFEPHNSLRRVAYFVTDPKQIRLRETFEAKAFLPAAS